MWLAEPADDGCFAQGTCPGAGFEPACSMLIPPADVTDAMLHGAFASCPGCSDARVM